MLLYRRNSLDPSSYRPSPLCFKRSLKRSIHPTPSFNLTLQLSKTPNPNHRKPFRSPPTRTPNPKMKLPNISLTLKSTPSTKSPSIFFGIQMKHIITSEEYEDEQVKMGFWKEKGVCVIYKEFEQDEINYKKVRQYKKCSRHINVVELLGSEKVENKIVLIVENTQAGNLLFVMTKFPKLPLITIKNIMQQILQGLVHIHSKDIVHMNLKGQNIMIDSKGVYKIGGWWKRVEEVGSKVVGVERIEELKKYTPPEQILVNQVEVCQSYDIWQVGCLLLEFCDSRILKISQKTTLQQRKQYLTVPFYIKYLQGYGEDFISIIQRCLHHQPKNRPKASDLLKMEFFCR